MRGLLGSTMWTWETTACATGHRPPIAANKTATGGIDTGGADLNPVRRGVIVAVLSHDHRLHRPRPERRETPFWATLVTVSAAAVLLFAVGSMDPANRVMDNGRAAIDSTGRGNRCRRGPHRLRRPGNDADVASIESACHPH